MLFVSQLPHKCPRCNGKILVTFCITALILLLFVSFTSSSRLHLNKVNCVDSINIVRRRMFGYYRYHLTVTEAAREREWMSKRMDAVKNRLSCDRLKSSLKTNPVMNISQYHVRYPSPVPMVPRLTELSSALLRIEDAVKTALGRDGINVKAGGWHVPDQCVPREVVGIVIPYRDRHSNLVTFLNYMHRYLPRQKRHYVIIIAEQSNSQPFNRAKLMNAALLEVMRDHPQVTCLVLHDVDKLPYHGLNIYGCEYHPKQMASMKWYYEIGKMEEYYEYFFGGVTALSKWHLLRMNGGSNTFYGWGGEDDDILSRALLAGLQPIFQSKYLGRMYVQQHHDDAVMIKQRYNMLYMDKVLHRMRHDGLQQVKYKQSYQIKRPLYTVYGLDV